MNYLGKYHLLFLVVSIIILSILGITPSYFRNDYIMLLDGMCVVSILLNSYLYATKRSRFLVTIVALCQLIYCLGTSSMDVEEEFTYTRMECLQGLEMHPVGVGETLEAAAALAALSFVVLEVVLVIKLLVSFSRTRYGLERN